MSMHDEQKQRIACTLSAPGLMMDTTQRGETCCHLTGPLADDRSKW
jgi:hypothetical protein